jgi:hypothetical protein
MVLCGKVLIDCGTLARRTLADEQQAAELSITYANTSSLTSPPNTQRTATTAATYTRSYGADFGTLQHPQLNQLTSPDIMNKVRFICANTISFAGHR